MERQNNNRLITVSFYCVLGKEFDTVEVLEESGITGIHSDFSESGRQIISGGKLIEQKGILFSGVINESEFPKLITALSGKKIAGYSRETQIIQTKNAD